MADNAAEPVRDVKQTGCCIVGGGPAGMVLALLLARQGIDTTLLEMHNDFDRDFRGDTIHPSTLEIMDQLGLADRLLQLPHGAIHSLQVVTPEGTTTLADLRRLKTRFPYVMMLPQAKFLDFLAQEARVYPQFHLLLGANVQRLVQEQGEVRGVRYRGADDGWHEVRAPLTVAADGRFSKVRSLVGLEPVKTAPPIDAVWFRLPRRADDAASEGSFYIREGHFAVALNRGDQWQIAYVILKGSFAQVRQAGIEAFRRILAGLLPWAADRLDQLHDWHDVAVLSVESSRLKQWYQPGLLLIGDAAHVMSPVGGVGINYAIQDAVETANLLGDSLRKGQVRVEELAAVQQRREWPVRVIQRFQSFMQDRLAAPALQNKPFRLPLVLRVLLRLPVLRDLPARLVGFGIRRVSVKR